MTKVKVCGLTNKNNITEIITVKPDFVGLLFYPKSIRFVVNKLSPKEINSISFNSTKKIGVFVNEKPEILLKMISLYNLDFVQLHGNENEEYCKSVNKHIPVIKAFQINNEFNFSALINFETACDYFLFDNATKNYGGSGKKFNWHLLSINKINKPYFLSGGIGLNDIDSIKKLNPFAVDINSKFEAAPGIKDIQATKEFILKIKN